jgi:UDP-GlcNAc:undecaprenyl-phosphate/decaprenyl-phosphate GlcNAc-1-phosphate transferase
MTGYLLIMAIAATVTGAFMPVCRWLARRYSVMAEPDTERRLHSAATPLLGGIAMCLGVVMALLAALFLPQFEGIFRSSEPLGVALGAVLITAFGLIDDVFEISAPSKLIGMVISGTVLYLLGVVMYYVRVPFFGILSISPDLIPLVTVVWLVGMANAINLIDGLDGLAAGIVGISAAAFFLYADRLFKAGLLPGDSMGPLIAAITVGICLGYLPWNFSPARIFMGDAGAQLLGLLLAASTMIVGGRADPSSTFQGQTYFFVAPLFIPFVILAVPMFDTALAIVRRTVNRKSPTVADRHHIHHRLVDLGHGPRRAVVILWSFTLIFSALALAPGYISGQWPLIPLTAAFFATVSFAVLHKDSTLWLRRKVRSGQHPADLAAERAAAGVIDLASRRQAVESDAAKQLDNPTPGVAESP